MILGYISDFYVRRSCKVSCVPLTCHIHIPFNWMFPTPTSIFLFHLSTTKPTLTTPDIKIYSNFHLSIFLNMAAPSVPPATIPDPEQECIICLDNLVQQNGFYQPDAIITKCKHYYHEACLIPCLNKKQQCPYCTQPLYHTDLTPLLINLDVIVDPSSNNNSDIPVIVINDEVAPPPLPTLPNPNIAPPMNNNVVLAQPLPEHFDEVAAPPLPPMNNNVFLAQPLPEHFDEVAAPPLPPLLNPNIAAPDAALETDSDMQDSDEDLFGDDFWADSDEDEDELMD